LANKLAAMERDYNATTFGCKHARSKTGGYHNMKGFAHDGGSPKSRKNMK